MSISATVVQSIANAYFKVIDKYNSSSDIITDATNLPGIGKNTVNMLAELTAALKDFKGEKYWMILNQGDVYYVIFLNSTVDDGVETKDSWIVGTYSTKSPGWVGTPVEYTYEITKTGENVTGLKLTPETGSAIEFNLTNDGDTPIATLNGTVDTQFAWTAAKRTAILTSSDIVIEDSDTNAVFYNPTNMKVDGDDFEFKGKYKYNTLDDSYYEQIGNFRDTNGFIILDGINIGNGEKDNNKQFTTWFSRSLHKINGIDYVHFKFGDGTDICQEIDIPKTDESEPDSIEYIDNGETKTIANYVIKNLPAYSGLEGNFAITILFCKLDLNQFNVKVDNYTDNGNVVHDKIQDPRSYLFRDPNSSSFGEISNQYVDQVTVDIVKVIPEYRKFYNGDSFTVGEGPVFYALSNDISNKKIPYGLVTLRVDQKIVKDNNDKYGSMYFIWNRSSDGIPDKRIVYSDNSPIQYDNGKYTPGEVTITDNTFKCKMPVQDLGIFNYQSTTSNLVEGGTEKIRDFPLVYEEVSGTKTGYQTFETLIPLLQLGATGSKVLMSACYNTSIKVTNDEVNNMNLVKCADDFASSSITDPDKKGLTFAYAIIQIANYSKYTIVFQLELINIDASGEHISYYGGEGGSKDTRYVRIYINKAEGATTVGFVEKWSDTATTNEISPIACTIDIGTDSFTLTNLTDDVATINADSLIVPRGSSFEDGIPINALAKFSDDVETTDDYVNYYKCDIVALYGPEAAGGGGQGDDGFINLFVGKLDIRLNSFDDTKTLTENYNYFKNSVNGYIDEQNYSPFANMTDFIGAISQQTYIVRSYFLTVFIKYRYVYDVTRSAGAKPVNGNVYHYYSSFMEYKPKLTNNANPTAANGKYNYSSGTVKNIFGTDIFSFEVTNSGSDSFISVYTDAEYGDNIIDFGDVKVNTLDDMTIDNIDIVPKNGDSNDIADYMINNGINMANVRTFNGTDMSFIPKDFDNEPGRTLKSVSIDRMIIRCIPVKSKV